MRLFDRIKRERRHTLVFREPISFALLEEASALMGIDPDDVLDDPKAALEGQRLPSREWQAFCDLVLARRIDLSRMTPGEAEVIAAYVLAGFFAEAWVQRLLARLESYKTSTGGQVLPGLTVGRA